MYPGDHAEQHPDQPALVMADVRRATDVRRVRGQRQPPRPPLPVASGCGAATTWRCSWRTTCATSRRWRRPSAPASTTRASTRTSRPEEVAYIVDDCDAKVFITSQAKAEVAVAAAAMTPKVETFLCVDADADDRPVPPVRRGARRVPGDADRRRAARRGDALLVGHDRPAEGHPAPAARGPPERAAAGDAVRRRQPVPHARGDDVPVAGADLPLRAAGVGGVRAAPRRRRR